MRQINRNLYPSMGYRFIEQDGSVHRATGWVKLERKVAEYRQRQGFEPGNVRAEIVNQVCGAAPNLCGETGPQGDRSEMTFNTRILEWLGWLMGQKRINALLHVDETTATARAAVCAVCPAQKSLSKSCGSCLAGIDVARKVISDRPFKNLSPCSVLHEDCAVSVWLKREPSHDPALPGACWRRP